MAMFWMAQQLAAYTKRYVFQANASTVSGSAFGALGLWQMQRRWMTYFKKNIRKPLPQRRCNPYLDGIVKREARLKYALKLKSVLLQQPEWVISIDFLKERRRRFRLGGLRIPYFVMDYPYVFEIYHDKDRRQFLHFTKQAEALFAEQKKYKKQQHGPYAVEAVRKLLMMSAKRRIRADKVAQLWKALGFPEDYETSIFLKYPQYYRVVEGKDGHKYLKLTEWDPELAITAREKWMKEAQISNPYAFPEPGSSPNDETTPYDIRNYFQYMQKIPFPSPYEDTMYLAPASPAATKRALAVCHEFLSLTIEKRALVDHLAQFKREFMLPERLQDFFMNHQPILYVTNKGDRHSLFLREAYDASNLKEKHPLWYFKERFFAMCMSVRQERYDQQPAKGSVYDDKDDPDAELNDDGPPPFVEGDENDADGWYT